MPVALVVTDTVLVGCLASNMALLPKSPTTPANVAIDCWSGVLLAVESTMPFVVEYDPSVMLDRKDFTEIVSVTGTPLTAVVRVAVTATHPHRASMTTVQGAINFTLDGVAEVCGWPSR